MAPRPTFLICGTMKGGTTSLYHYLKRHPEIYLPEIKELHYFDEDRKYRKGIEYYLKYFRGASSRHKAIGEVTPGYMYFEWVPERIFEQFPDIKLIFILRDPVDRAWSHYWHAVTRGAYEYLNFEEAIRQEPFRITQGFTERRRYSYLDRGKYIVQLKRFIKYFSKDQMLVLFTENLKKEPLSVLREIFLFLGVDPELYPGVDPSKHNIGYRPKHMNLQLTLNKIGTVRYIGEVYRRVLKITRNTKLLRELLFEPGYPSLNPELQRQLAKYFKPYNKRLEKFLGKKLPDWKL